MTHQARRGPPLECPLASLGRNMPTLESQKYHHPLSTSPLNPQVYQMSRKSPILSIDTDDIIYSSPETHNKDNKNQNDISDIYHLSHSSSSSIDQAYNLRHCDQTNNYHPILPPKNNNSINELIQFHDRHDRKTSSKSNYLNHNANNNNNNNNNNNSKNDLCRDSNTQNPSNIVDIDHTGHNEQYFLEEKMDSLYIHGAIRSIPLGSESNNYKNERYYLEDNLKTMYDYDTSNRLHDNISNNLRRPSSPSETSGSDRYLIHGSPAFVNKTRTNYKNKIENHQLITNTTAKLPYYPKNLTNFGRFSPNLDQGYATLVSPSPSGCCNNQISSSTTLIPWNNKKLTYHSGPYFDILTDNIIIKIFSWLDSLDLCNVSSVCHRFEFIAWQSILWKIIILNGEYISGDKALKMIFRRLCGQTRNGSCPDIEKVMLSDGCKISDKGLQLLARRCPELTHLQLHNCINITNPGLCEVLTKCTNIRHLDVTGCSQITSISVIPSIEAHRRLLIQYLDLTDCSVIDDIGLKIVVRNCPQLIFLYLRRCVMITDIGLKFIPSFCATLKELSISDCTNITDFGLYELAKLGAALRYLSVAKCDRVSDAGLGVIARRCYKLRYLNARGCEAVSDDSIISLARSCPRLRALDIGKCDVSDAGLRALAESCPNLKKLSLRNCDMITDRGIQCIAYYCRGLQQLNIQDCQISIEGYRAVKKYCKRCVIEHTNPGFC